MRDELLFDANHALHGAKVIDPDSLRTIGTNFIVFEDGSHTSVGTGVVTGDVEVFRGAVSDVVETIEEEGWRIVQMDDEAFIEQTHELEQAVEDGQFDDENWR